MAQSVSSAEPEKLLRYSNFGMQVDHALDLEAARLASALQHFEATCTEPGFQVGVGHLEGGLRGYAGQSESVDSWVRQVGQGFQMADQGWSGAVPRPGGVISVRWPLHGWIGGVISLIPLLPTLPDWLMGLVRSLPWVRSDNLKMMMVDIPRPGDLLYQPTVSPTEYRSWESIRSTEMAFTQQVKGLERYLENLGQQEQQLLERQRQIEAELEQWQNRVIPDTPVTIGFDDGVLDAPWRTKADALEDESADIDMRLVQIREEFERTEQAVEQTRQAYEAWKIKPLDAPYVSQWNRNAQNGGGNCGPASLAMVVNYYGGAITNDEAVSKVRRGSTGHTNFKSEEAKALLDEYGLKQEDVDGFDDLQKHLDQDHPVVMLVDNSQYIRHENDRDVPYPNTEGFKDDHIVVVTGYERSPDGKVQYVYINDPLAIKLEGKQYVADPEGGANFKVAFDDFSEAVTNEGWYGAAVLPK